MQLPKVRFTIRSLLVAVALVALNLAGAVASPRKDWSVGGIASGTGSFYHDWRPEYGLICTYEGKTQSTTGTIVYKLWSVGRVPLPPSLLQAWSPVIASVSITLLVLTLGPWYLGTVSRSVPPQTRGATPTRPPREWLAPRFMAIIIAMIAMIFVSTVFEPITLVYRVAIVGLVLLACLLEWGAVLPRLWPVARWVLLVVALIALNLVSAVSPPSFNLYELTWSNRLPRPPRGFSILFVGDFRPSPPLPPQPIEPFPGTHLELNYKSLFADVPRVLNLSIDGTLVQRCAMEVDLAGMKRLPEVIFQGFPIGEATIDFRADGNVVSYRGRPGIKLSQPRVLRPPSFSFLEMRWPVIASASLTLLVLVVTVRRLSPRQIRTLVIVVTLSGIDLAGAFAYFAREQPRLLSSTWGDAGGSEEYYSDGSRHFYVGGVYVGIMGSPRRLTRIERPNPPPSILQTWWPIMTSAGITLLVLGILWRQARHRSIEAANAIHFGQDPSVGSQRLAGDTVEPS
jgi:hypothetical protein